MGKLRKLVVLLITAGLTISAVGCGGKTETGSNDPGTPAAVEENKKEAKKDPIVIKYPTFQVGVNSGAPALQKNIELFNEAYGDEIRVEVEEIPGDQAYVDKMKILLASGELPDLVYAGGYNLLDLAVNSGLAVDLTPYFEEDPDWRASFSDTDLEYNSREGKFYGVPEEIQPVGYFYNKELFAKAGLEGPAKTWDEFFEQCEKLKAAGITPLSMDTADSGWITSLWMGSMVAVASDAGREWMNTNTVNDYNIPEFIDAAARIKKMLQEYTTVDAIGGKYENGANNFLSEKTAMIANGPWMIPDFSDPDKADSGFAEKIGVALYPEEAVYDAPMYGYFVASKDKEHADATVKFLKFITNEEAQLRALDMIGRIPPSPRLEITEDVRAAHPLLAEFVDKVQEAKIKSAYPQGIWYPNVVDQFSVVLPSLAMDQLTPEQFAQELTNTANKN